MKSFLLLLLSAALLSGCGRPRSPAPAAAPVKLSYADILTMQFDPARLADLSLPVSHLASSSDPTGDNNDWAEFLNTGKGGWDTILDVEGPGYLSRAWTTGWGDDQRKFRVYLDDMEKPVAEFSFQDWFRGEKGPLIRLENLCAYSYLPVPYNKRLRIDVEVGKPGGRFYYQFNTARLPAGSSVETVGFPIQAPATPAVKLAEKAWADFSAPPALLPNPTAIKLEAKGSFDLPVLNGPGVIERIEILPPAGLMSDSAGLQSFLREVMIEIRWDGATEPSVLCPIGDFCGQAGEWVNAATLGFGAQDGRMFNRLPMPHRVSAAIRLTNDGSKAYEFQMAVSRTQVVPDTAGFLHAAWSLSLPRDVGPRHVVLRAKGRGRVAGLLLSVDLPKEETDRQSWWILEGDEQVRVDDEILPGWRGTGLEDCFNGGWYYRTVVANPLSGLLRKVPYEAFQYRFFTLDAPGFNSSVDIEFERGGQNNDPVRMESTLFYYLDTPAVSGSRLPADPGLRVVDRIAAKDQIMTRVAQLEALGDEAGVSRLLGTWAARQTNVADRARFSLRLLAGKALTGGWPAVQGELPSLDGSPATQEIVAQLKRAFGTAGEGVVVVYAQPGVEVMLDGNKLGDAATGGVSVFPAALSSGRHLLALSAASGSKDAWLHVQVWSGGKVVASSGTHCRFAMDPPAGWNTVAFDDRGWTTYFNRSLGIPGPDSHLPGPPAYVFPGLVGRTGNIVRPPENGAKTVAYRLPFDLP